MTTSLTPPSMPRATEEAPGSTFVPEDLTYRHVSPAHRAHYEQLMTSGLYESLAGAGKLLRHGAIDPASLGRPDAYTVLQPESLPFVSYPYEWCFSQLKHAALLILDVQEAAIRQGMTLRDVDAGSVQFRDGRPVFVDTLAFVGWQEGRPWRGYRRFCTELLAPLALMAYTDVRLAWLLQGRLDGIPLDLAATLLPIRSKMKPALLTHLHLHARAGSKPPEEATDRASRAVGKRAMLGLVDHLRGAIRGLRWTAPSPPPDGAPVGSAIGASPARSAAVDEMVQAIRPSQVWDLNARDGALGRQISRQDIPTVAFDADFAAVERNYLRMVRHDEPSLLPLVLDVRNPSPSLGFEGTERASLVQRGPVDLVLALDLVHHLAVGSEIPLPRVAAFLARIARNLIIEFVPKSDSHLQRMLAAHADIFPDYGRRAFETSFQDLFEIQRRESIPRSTRVLYHMSRRTPLPSGA